jgi:hypothetical protein
VLPDPSPRAGPRAWPAPPPTRNSPTPARSSSPVTLRALTSHPAPAPWVAPCLPLSRCRASPRLNLLLCDPNRTSNRLERSLWWDGCRCQTTYASGRGIFAARWFPFHFTRCNGELVCTACMHARRIGFAGLLGSACGQNGGLREIRTDRQRRSSVRSEREYGVCTAALPERVHPRRAIAAISLDA